MRRRPRAERATRRSTVASAVERELGALVAALETGQWPALEWQNDPVGFWERMGVEFLEHQIQIMRAVLEHPRVAVSSGQKIGKTFLLACLIWWYWAAHEKARITIMATTGTQVDNVVWDEVKNLYRIALAHGVDLLAGGSTMAEDFHTGVEAPDGRTIRGLTISQVEAAGGISGENQLFVIDEASSASEQLGHAIIGNTAAGNKVLLTSNPTRAEGPFFDAFHRQKAFWKTFMLSSADIAERVHTSGKKFPGIASKAVLDEWREMFGVKSVFWLVRVLGEFLTQETGKIVSMHALALSQKLWLATVSKPEDGILSIGIDVAGEGEDGDEWGFCARRGKRVLDLRADRALTEDEAIELLRSLLSLYRHGDETPRVITDATGKLGSQFLGRLRAIAAQLKKHHPAKAFEVWGVHAHVPAQRQPLHYALLRDELWASMAAWILDGGAIPNDFMLEADIHAASWTLLDRGQRKATSKKELRRILGRSPDRGDALALAVWEPDIWLPQQPTAARGVPPREVQDAAMDLDPYDGAAWAWGGE